MRALQQACPAPTCWASCTRLQETYCQCPTATRPSSRLVGQPFEGARRPPRAPPDPSSLIRTRTHFIRMRCRTRRRPTVRSLCRRRRRRRPPRPPRPPPRPPPPRRRRRRRPLRRRRRQARRADRSAAHAVRRRRRRRRERRRGRSDGPTAVRRPAADDAGDATARRSVAHPARPLRLALVERAAATSLRIRRVPSARAAALAAAALRAAAPAARAIAAPARRRRERRRVSSARAERRRRHGGGTIWRATGGDALDAAAAMAARSMPRKAGAAAPPPPRMSVSPQRGGGGGRPGGSRIDAAAAAAAAASAFTVEPSVPDAEGKAAAAAAAGGAAVQVMKEAVAARGAEMQQQQQVQRQQQQRMFSSNLSASLLPPSPPAQPPHHLRAASSTTAFGDGAPSGGAAEPPPTVDAEDLGGTLVADAAELLEHAALRTRHRVHAAVRVQHPLASARQRLAAAPPLGGGGGGGGARGDGSAGEIRERTSTPRRQAAGGNRARPRSRAAAGVGGGAARRGGAAARALPRGGASLRRAAADEPTPARWCRQSAGRPRCSARVAALGPLFDPVYVTSGAQSNEDDGAVRHQLHHLGRAAQRLLPRRPAGLGTVMTRRAMAKLPYERISIGDDRAPAGWRRGRRRRRSLAPRCQLEPWRRRATHLARHAATNAPRRARRGVRADSAARRDALVGEPFCCPREPGAGVSCRWPQQAPRAAAGGLGLFDGLMAVQKKRPVHEEAYSQHGRWVARAAPATT